ncbi:MAG: hypothetical protein DHS20C05_08030 [Hyphococcus sp.]|nr:MAG: hypothetical protein DHS20C05_08030 [Marinicaulis sp.]
MDTESASAEQAVAEQSNWILDFLSAIPSEIWVVLATAIVGLIGWFGKTGFDAWNQSRLPFKQDRDRYQAVMGAIEPQHLHYLKQTPMNSIGNRALDGIEDACEQLSRLATSQPGYLHQKLGSYEKELLASVGDLAEFLPYKLYPHHANGNLYTMYWDNFDEYSDEDQRRASEKQTEIMAKVDAVISAFETYRDYGNRLFADRLVKEKSDG